LAGAFAGCAGAQEETDAAVAEPPTSVRAPDVRIRAPRFVTPLPGVVIERSQTTTNVQSVTSTQLRESQAVNVTDYLGSNMQSVNVNDYSGNPFQQDIVYRGFSASPLIGTPQGLSAYLDGVRVNEPFGEVVNWDLIPVNAIQRMELMPGSDPLFGLNTLGGALAITTKSGFTAPKGEITLLGGSWGRRQAQVSLGGNNGTVGAFLALNRFQEDGWRASSPSDVTQAYGRIDIQGRRVSGGISYLFADNTLIGNGLVPYEQYVTDPNSVFTSPDEVRNKVNHVNGNARVDLSDDMSLSGLAYYRKLEQRSSAGDYWEDFGGAAARLRLPCPNVPIPNATADGAVGVDLPGCPNVQPNGIFNIGQSDQQATGASFQYSWATDRNQLVVGSAYDQNEVDFRQSQRLGFIDSNRNGFLTPERYDDLGLTALVQDIQRNNLNGGSQSISVFAKNIWSARPNLHFTAGLRYNHTRVTSNLVADRPIPLYQFDDSFFRRLQQRCGAEIGGPANALARYYCTSGNYLYESLNPSAGISWLPREDVNLYVNWSKGNRVPSVIELGCARDRQAEDLAASGTSTGKTPGCSIPTGLTYDPFLPQVRSYTIEVGIRGSVYDRMLWNLSFYQTNLADDILFVSLGTRNRGVFDTFGKTRRRGMELGLEGEAGRHYFRAAYSRIDATFESPAEIVNLSNSTSTKEVGKVNTFVVQPGDRIPGIPRDSLRLAWRYRWTPDLTFGLSMIANSWSYVRGNENNDHQPGGTDSNGAPTNGTIDPSITVEPGRRYVGEGRIPGYAIFNMLASYRIARGLLLTLRVDNLFDTRYVTAGELALNPFTTGQWGVRDTAGFNYNSNDWTHSTFVGPGAPRAAWVGVTYVFDMPGASKQ
jgi:outer membrane receptor protein involved in Fe transport